MRYAGSKTASQHYSVMGMHDKCVSRFLGFYRIVNLSSMGMPMKPKCLDSYERYNGPVHLWFSLSYSSYYCVPRLALQGMPIWWQKIFVWLINMMPETPEYVCQRRDGAGRFVKDPWANYRRGSIAQILYEQEQNKLNQDWVLLNVEHPQE